MENIWQLQEAKNRFSAVVKAAQTGEPQIITKHGKEVVILLSVEQYESLTKPEGDLVDFFANSPLAGVDLEVTRDKSPLRKPIDL